MPTSTTFALIDAETRKRIGTITLDEPSLPGELVRRFRRDEFQLEALAPRPPFEGAPGVHDERGARRPKAKKPA